MFYFFMATAPTDIYTLSLHDALPILPDQKIGDDGDAEGGERRIDRIAGRNPEAGDEAATPDRKSTRLNSSHRTISYAVFCLKKKNKRTSAHSSLQHVETQSDSNSRTK